MLDIVYFSNVSNNTHRFVDKLDWPSDKIHRIPLKVAVSSEFSTLMFLSALRMEKLIMAMFHLK